MRIQENQDLVEVLSSTDLGGDTEFSVDQENMGRIYRMFYQYGDPIGSVVREITSNAVDAHAEAADYRDLSLIKLIEAGYGKEVDTQFRRRQALLKETNGTETSLVVPPSIVFGASSDRISYLQDMKRRFSSWEDRNVIVEVVPGNEWAGTPTLLRISDFGVGLSPARVKGVYAKFGSSTKASTDRQIGAFGLGAKTPLGYGPLFIVRTRWEGVEYEYAIHRTDKAPVIKPLGQEPTDKPNGTTIEVSINEGDEPDVQRAIKHQLAYFDGVSFVGTEVQPGRIVRGNTFIYRENSPFTGLHLCLGKVYYPLNASALGITNPIDVPLGIYVPLEHITGEDPVDGFVSIVWNRESVQYNKTTREYLLSRYYEMKVEIQELFESQVEGIESMKDYVDAVLDRRAKSVRLAEDISIPVKGFKLAKIEYPRYGALKKTPQDPYFQWSVLKRMVDGKLDRKNYEYSDLLRTVKDYVLGEESVTLAVTSGLNRLSPLKNRYLQSLGYDTVYFVGRTKKMIQRKLEEGEEEEDENLWIEDREWYWPYFGYGHDNPPGEDEKILIDFFIEEVDQHLRTDYIDYDSLVVPESFKQEEKERQRQIREQKKFQRPEGSFPARWLEQSGSASNYGEFVWKMGDYSRDAAMNGSQLVVYGFMEDDELLKEVGAVIWANFAFRLSRVIRYDSASKKHIFTGEWKEESDILPSKACVLKIAQGNAQYFNDNPHAMHVKEFIRGNKVMVRYATAYQIMKRLDPDYQVLASPFMKILDLGTYRAATFLQKYLKQYYATMRGVQMSEFILAQIEEGERIRLDTMKRMRLMQQKIMESETDPLRRKLLLTKYKLPERPPLLDYEAIENYKQVARFLQAYPFITSLDASNISPKATKALKEFMALRGPLHHLNRKHHVQQRSGN